MNIEHLLSKLRFAIIAEAKIGMVAARVEAEDALVNSIAPNLVSTADADTFTIIQRLLSAVYDAVITENESNYTSPMATAQRMTTEANLVFKLAQFGAVA